MGTRTLVANLRLLKTLEDLSGRLRGLDVVLLKGGALIASGVADPRKRGMEDLDLLVRPDGLRKLRRALESLGFAKRPDTAGDFIMEGLMIDVHTGVWYLSDTELEGIFHRARKVPLGESRVLIPSPQDQLIFTLAHAAVHHGEAEPKWARDVSDLMAAHPDLDAGKVRAELERLGLWPAVEWFSDRVGLDLFRETAGRSEREEARRPAAREASDRSGRKAERGAASPPPPRSWSVLLGLTLLERGRFDHRGHLLRLIFLRDNRFRARHLLRQIFPPSEILVLRHDCRTQGSRLAWRLLRPVALLGKLVMALWDAGRFSAGRSSAGRSPADST